MKFLVPVLLVALAAGQQFQQQQNTSPAVWVARPGYFQQGGSNNFRSSQNRNNQFQSNSFQNNNFRSQNENSRSSSFRSADNQFNRFQNQNQYRFASDNNQNEFQRRESFQRNNQNNQNNRAQFRSGNDNQFQPLRQNRFESGSFQQDQNRIQSTNFQQNQDRFQSNFQQRNQDRFQSNSFQQNNQNQNQNRFQSSSFQQNNQNLLQGNENRFQSQFRNSNNFRSSEFQQSNRNLQNQQRDRFQQQGQSQFRSFENFEGSFEPLNLPSGARFVLGDDISTSFTCANRPYGYYADQDNSCRVFHVCNPSLFSSGEVQTYQYSFMCGEGTVFDQKELTCMQESEATSCQEAASFYSRNEAFGRNEEF